MMTTLQILGAFAGVFFLGYGLRSFLAWLDIRTLKALAKEDSETITRLKHQVKLLGGEQMASYRQAVSQVAHDNFTSGFIAGRKEPATK